MTTLKFEMTILTNEKTNEANRIYDVKMKIFVTQKFSSSSKIQIKKFNHFLTDSIAVNASNEKKFAFENFLKSLIIIDFTDLSLKTHAIVCYKKIKLSKYQHMKIKIRIQLLKDEKKISNTNIINFDENDDINERIKFKDNVNEK